MQTETKTGFMKLDLVRRIYSEELRISCNLRSALLVEAFASVPRESFLGPGPWWVRGAEASIQGPLSWPTPDADPRHVYHNVSVAIDPSRNLFNGQPGLLATWLDALQLETGSHVLHVGCATGYYSGVMAHVVGATGRVVAVEIDAALSERARQNLAQYDWVEVRQADGTQAYAETFDSIVINAGATHPLPSWLDALRPGGRLVVPLTFTVAQMPAGIGKGGALLITRRENDYDVSFLTVVAVYSCEGARDEAMNERLRAAFTRGAFSVRRLRRDLHEVSTACWLHGESFCLSS
jgi:protein-L-isoaspartate(D-aspartate) O-methyltransferase